MPYITLNECIKELENRPITEPLALERDKVTGWHVTIFKGHQPSVEVICAEVNLLDPKADKVVKAVSALFQGAFSKLEDIVKRERASYEKALQDRKVSQHIQSYNITNQSLLYDIALKDAEHYGQGVSQYIKNYGIESEEMRFQIALKAAEQGASGLSHFIENYGIKTQEKLYRIALKAAAQNEWVSVCIRNYGIKEKEKLYQIALIAARSASEWLSQYIDEYGLEDKEWLFQIALTAAGQRGSGISKHIKKFGIEDEERLYQIALIAAANDGKGVSEHIQNYGNKDAERLFQIALKAAAQSGEGVSQFIQNYGIKEEERLYRIALAAAQDGMGVSQFIQNYGIKDEERQYLIALKAAEHNALGVSLYIRNYGIKDKDRRYQLALTAVERNARRVSEYIKDYDIEDGERLFQIALKTAMQDGWGTSEFIQNYGITDKKKLYQIAALAAGQSGEGVSQFIQNYGIEEEEKLYQIALKAAGQDGFGTSRYIKNYGIGTQEKLYQIALRAAAQSAGGVSYYLKNYGILSEEEQYQIALKAAAQSGQRVSVHIQNFCIKDEEKRYRIALKAADNDGGGTSEYMKNYGFKDHEKLFRIAMRAIIQNPERTVQYLDNYEQTGDHAFKLFALSLMNPSMSTERHRNAFVSLIVALREKEFPAFLMAENPDPFVRQKLSKWIVELLFTDFTNEQIESEQPLFTQLMQLRNPVLRSQLTAYLPEVYKSRDAWKALQAIPLKVPKKDSTQLARLLHLGLEPNTLSAFYSKLEDPFDQELYFLFLLKIKGLKTEEHLLRQLLTQTNRKAMLHFMRTAVDIITFGYPELTGGDLDKQLEHLFLTELQGLKVPNFTDAYEQTLGKFRSKELIFTYLSSIRSQGTQATAYFKDIVEFILNGTFFDKRYDVPHLKMIFAKFPIEESWRKGEKGLTMSELLTGPVEVQVQIPISLADMRAKIITDKHLKISENSSLYKCLMGEDREECLKKLQSEIQITKGREDLKIEIKCLQLLDPDLTAENKTKYLENLEQLCRNTQFENDVKTWRALMRPVTSRSDYSVSDTDDPNHLFLLGEEVSGSCQKITGGASVLNKGLLGYMLNGYNRAVVVTDKSGAIVARSLLRLYWDGEKPVLYQERFYTRSNDAKLKPLVDAMCLRRAKALNVSLVSAEGSDPYPKALQITGGRVDIEYIDAIGGVQTSRHTVPVSYIK